MDFTNGPIPEVATQIDGHSSTAIRFCNGAGGCCTTAYNYSLSHEQKEDLAERIAAGLNATRKMSIDDIRRMGR